MCERDRERGGRGREGGVRGEREIERDGGRMRGGKKE